MLRLTIHAARRITSLCSGINSLLAERECADSHSITLNTVTLSVPGEVVRAEIDKRIASATDELRSLGIEFVPG